MKYKIYTDGACSGNPGPGGWGVIILENNEVKDMEHYRQLMGNIDGLQYVEQELKSLLEKQELIDD